jgi:hypothetical protein
VPPRSRPRPLDFSDLTPVLLDGFVQRLIAVSDHVIEHFERATRATVKRDLR